MNDFLLRQVKKTIDKLSSTISILDEYGNCLIPEADIRFVLPYGLIGGEISCKDGRLFLRCERSGIVLMNIGEDTPAARDTLILTASLINALSESDINGNDVSHVYKRLLQNELSVSEITNLANERGISSECSRCVFLIYMQQTGIRSATSILDEYLPKLPGDILVEIDRHTTALLKDTGTVDEIDDLIQFARAVQETIESETSIKLIIGIGGIVESISKLHSSYRQARRAIEIGRVFRESESVFLYRSMLMERFLSDLSVETAIHYHNLLFNAENEKLFSEEMLQTIEMFFKKDLNLSDTARQLYIHRNTLVYRLDKVQRQVGLDLRRFEDAVTFKMLLEMKKCADNAPKE